MNRFLSLAVTLVLILTLAGCGAGTAVPTQPEITPAPSAELTEEPLESTASAVTSEPVQTGLFAEQIFSGADGDIHYSYYLPESYDGSRKFPMMVVMPGYGMMWFGEDSSGSNLNWSGFTAWTKLDTEIIVISAQLTDWGEKSARQAIELTEYFISHFAVDTSRVYAAGYSAGGETMSRAVSMRPDLYAAYLHGASQWDGSYAPIAENSVAISISTWPTATSITAAPRPARPTKISTMPMKMSVGAMPTSTRFFVLKHPIMPSSTKRAFITTTAALMWSLTIRIT